MGITYEDEVPATPRITYEERRRIPAPDSKRLEPVELSAADRMLAGIPDLPQWAQNVLTGATGLTRGTLNLASRPFQEKTMGELIAPGTSKGLGDIMAPAAKGSEGSTGKMVGQFLDPLAWAIGGGVPAAAAKMLAKLAASGPAAARVAEGLARHWYGRATGRAVAGGVTGGTIGALSEDGSTEGGAMLGAGINVALPPAIAGAIKGITAAKNTIYPTAGSLGVRAAGDKADDVIRALETTRSGVPGVNLTGGQAAVPANSAEFAALQQLVATRGDPSRYFGPKGIEGQQETARLGAMAGEFGTAADINAAKLARSAESRGNYETAFNVAVRRNPELRTLWNNPYFKDELPEAWKIMRAEGLSPTKDLTRLLHYVKLGLDARIESATKPGQPAISEASKRAIGNLQDELVGWMGKNNPQYEAARAAHQAASQPINQMKIGQELERVMTAPATGAERPASFGAALRRMETTIDKKTGKPTIEGLTTSQRDLVNALVDDFKRDAAYQELSKAGRSNLAERVGKEELPPTGFFQPMVSAARSWVNRLLGTGFEKGINRAAPVFENPQELASAMRQATPRQREMLARYIAASAISGIEQGSAPEQK